MYKGVFRAMLIAVSATAASAKEGPITRIPFAFNPSSATASSITGPIILSTNRIVFANGASADLKLIDPARQGAWATSTSSSTSAELFEIATDPGALLNDNFLCSKDVPARFMTVYRSKGVLGGSVLNVAIFSGGDAPTSASSSQICGTYTYSTEWKSLPAGDGPYGASTTAAAPSPAEKGKWQLSVKKNPMDDSKTVVAALEADSGRSSFGEPVYLIARCMSNKTEVYVNWNDYLGNDSNNMDSPIKFVIIRKGKDKPETRSWIVSTDSKATFTRMPGASFLRSLAGKGQLVLQTTPYNSNPITAVFTTQGMRAALSDLATTCHWSF